MNHSETFTSLTYVTPPPKKKRAPNASLGNEKCKQSYMASLSSHFIKQSVHTHKSINHFSSISYLSHVTSLIPKKEHVITQLKRAIGVLDKQMNTAPVPRSIATAAVTFFHITRLSSPGCKAVSKPMAEAPSRLPADHSQRPKRSSSAGDKWLRLKANQ